MNTTITSPHANVANTIATFCVHHKVDFRLTHTADMYIVHLHLANPFLVTKLQDELICMFHSHTFNIQVAA